MNLHLAPLCDGWSMWRWVALRSAGFPASTITQLAALETTAAIDRLLELELQRDRAHPAAMRGCDHAIEEASGDERHRVRKVLKRLGSGHVAALRLADEACHAQYQVIAASFEQETRQTSGAVRDLARDPRFREAITWQNRRALHDGVDVLLRQPAVASDAKSRKGERMIASYLQRYCVKNDRIGFFGPIGWVRVVDDEHAARIQPGATLLEHRTVFFEYWCIDALAAKLAEDPELRADLAPRRMPTVRLEGTTLWHPINRSTRIEPEHAALLAACTGEKSARTIARELSADPILGVSEDDVYTSRNESRRALLDFDRLPIARSDGAIKMVLRGGHREHPRSSGRCATRGA